MHTKVIRFKEFMPVNYPCGIYWNSQYPQSIANIIFKIYKGWIENDGAITLVVRGTSGAMIAGAVITELHELWSNIRTYVVVVRKPNENSHCESLQGIEEINSSVYIVVDDFIVTGETIQSILFDLDKHFNQNSKYVKTYDMLCISTPISKKDLTDNTSDKGKVYQAIFSRFKHLVCSPFQI